MVINFLTIQVFVVSQDSSQSAVTQWVFKEEFIQDFMNYMDYLAEDTHTFKRDGFLG